MIVINLSDNKQTKTFKTSKYMGNHVMQLRRITCDFKLVMM